MSKHTGWNRRLSVAVDAKGLVGHAGAVLLRKCADQTGLTGAFSAALGRIAKVRAKVRAHVWDLLAQRPGGFPWLVIMGKVLTGWIVIDLDATIVLAHSEKQGAAATFKKTYGFHPLGGWCANTQESLAMLLRNGNAGSNTVTDHITVLTGALTQIPAAYRAKILIRVDGAGATHDLLDHLHTLTTSRHTVKYTVGWTITAADEEAIAQLPADVWESALDQDGDVQKKCRVAELTGLNQRAGWPETMRLIVRRTPWSRRQEKKLTAFERETGWRYQVTATNITRMRSVPGSHQPQFLDVLHRAHAVVEDRVRTNKSMGIRNLPFKTWDVNVGWVLACNIAADLDAWTRLLGLYEHDNLTLAEPDTLRHRLWHLPAKLVSHARQRHLKISADWPWRHAFLDCWNRLSALPGLT